MSTHGYNMPDGPATAPPPPPSAGPTQSSPGAHPGVPHQGTDPTAVGVRRGLAWLIDAVIFVVLLLTFSAIGPFGRYETEATLAEAGFTLDDGCVAIEEATGTSQCFSAPSGVPFLEDDRLYFIDNEHLVLGTAAWLAYFVLVYVVIQGVTGATAGKYVTGVRVVDDLGRPPGMGRSLARSALWVVDGTPWIIPGLVAFIVSLISVGHRRIGDMAAATFVVRTTDAGRPLRVPGHVTPATPEYRLPERPQPQSEPAAERVAEQPRSTQVPEASPSQEAPAAQEAPPPPPPPVHSPQWDSDRDAYIQWDPARGRWLQWDATAERWHAI